VGGAHYKGADYQHWDYVNDVRLHYLPATASKYVSRNRRKNGVEDLEKSIHYIDKAEECQASGSITNHRMASFWRFVAENNLTIDEAMACYYIQEAEWEAARIAVQMLIKGAS
jgi:hypothetical protein